MKRQKLIKLYTKSGDKGESGLGDGARLPKSDLVFEVLGGIDEVNSWLGLVVASANKFQISNNKLQNKSKYQNSNYQTIIDELLGIQNTLLIVGAVVSGSEEQRFEKEIETEVGELEERIDWYQGQLGKDWYKQFLLPGGTELAARIDVTRTVVRRVERVLVRWIQYLNGKGDHRITAVPGGTRHAEFTESQKKWSPAMARYLNRLSDYLFALRCYVNWINKFKEHRFNR